MFKLLIRLNKYLKRQRSYKVSMILNKYAKTNFHAPVKKLYSKDISRLFVVNKY